jgi:hypothetical protein
LVPVGGTVIGPDELKFTVMLSNTAGSTTNSQ